EPPPLKIRAPLRWASRRSAQSQFHRACCSTWIENSGVSEVRPASAHILQRRPPPRRAENVAKEEDTADEASTTLGSGRHQRPPGKVSQREWSSLPVTGRT